MLWAFFVALVVATASATWPPGKEIPCARWVYPLGQSKSRYCGNEIDGPPIPMECLSCAECRKGCKGSGYKFGMCVKQVMHTKYLVKLPCYNVFKCVCTNDAPAKGCKSCARECEGENRFVSGKCNTQTYECQCKYCVRCFDEELARYPDPLTPAQRNVIIAEHNTRRTNLTRGFVDTGRVLVNEKLPEASNIFKLTWDTDLELLARRKASLCVSDGYGGQEEIPNQGLNFYGINGVFGTVLAMKEAAALWWSKKAFFYVERGRFEVAQDTTPEDKCWLFTQMAWCVVTRVGCAVGSCKQAKNTIVACVYDRSIHQIPDSKLYGVGKPCSACPAGTSRTCNPNQGPYLCTRT